MSEAPAVDELRAGAGPYPVAWSTVRVSRYTGTALAPGPNATPFLPGYGVNPARLALDY